jgi:hypothetical protein
MLGLFEMFRCIGIHKMWYLSIPLILAGGAMPTVARVLDTRESDLHFIMLGTAVILALYILPFRRATLSGAPFRLLPNSIGLAQS